MKLYFAIVALFAVAAASPLARNAKVSDEVAAILEAIQSPSTHPATAAILQEYLESILAGAAPVGVNPVIVPEPAIVVGEPILVGAPIIDQFEPIAVGPAIIDFPAPEPEVEGSPIHIGAEIIDFPVGEINPSPVIVAPTPVAPEASSAPLVQIILNINQAQSEVVPAPVLVDAPVAVDPVIVVDHAPIPADPVIIVDTPIIPDPVIIGEPIIPEPVIIGTPIIPEPVIIGTPVIPEPVIIGTPILPSPVINLPEELN